MEIGPAMKKLNNWVDMQCQPKKTQQNTGHLDLDGEQNRRQHFTFIENCSGSTSWVLCRVLKKAIVELQK